MISHSVMQLNTKSFSIFLLFLNEIYFLYCATNIFVVYLYLLDFLMSLFLADIIYSSEFWYSFLKKIILVYFSCKSFSNVSRQCILTKHTRVPSLTSSDANFWKYFYIPSHNKQFLTGNEKIFLP